MKRSLMLLGILIGYLVTNNLVADAQENSQTKEKPHKAHEAEVHDHDVEHVAEAKQEPTDSRLEARREHARLERDLRIVRQKQQAASQENEIQVRLELEQEDADEEDELEFEFDDLEEKLEAWAEQHSESWERWAEKLENRMDRWASEMEDEWENWADDYAERWEEWAEELESGLDEEDVQEMLQKNLKMLSKMPLDSLTEGLSELSKEDIPLESLGELNELIAGSLEKTMVELERSLKDPRFNEKLKGANQESQRMMKLSLQRLEEALAAQRDHLDEAEQRQIVELKKVLQKQQAKEEHARAQKMAAELMKQHQDQAHYKWKIKQAESEAVMKDLHNALQSKAGEARELKVQLELLRDHGEATDDVETALESTVSELKAIESKLASVKLMLQQEGDSKDLQKAAIHEKLLKARYQAQQKAAEAAERAMEERDRAANQRNIEMKLARELELNKAREMELRKRQNEEKSNAVEALYRKLLDKSERLEAKETELQQMRREIQELRNAVEKLKAKGGGNRK